MPYLPLADFQGIYHNRVAWIVGKGRTEYDYADLAKTTDPVIWINDAVSLENVLNDKQASFMVCLDKCMRPWLATPLKSIIVSHQNVIGVTGFQPHSDNRIIKFWPERGFVPAQQLARESKLYVEQGSICTVLSFAWFMGVRNVKLIGCDGINNKMKRKPYDSRIDVKSRSIPGWVYDSIKEKQERLLKYLQMKAEYLGTPTD